MSESRAGEQGNPAVLRMSARCDTAGPFCHDGEHDLTQLGRLNSECVKRLMVPMLSSRMQC